MAHVCAGPWFFSLPRNLKFAMLATVTCVGNGLGITLFRSIVCDRTSALIAKRTFLGINRLKKVRFGLGKTCGPVVFFDLVGVVESIGLAMGAFDTTKRQRWVSTYKRTIKAIIMKLPTGYLEIKPNPMSYAGHRNYCVEADLVVMRVVSQVQDRYAFE